MHTVACKYFGPLPLRLILAVLLLILSSHALASPRVVVSLKPIHSLVAGLMQGVTEPQLLLDDSQSPHSLSLKPSQMRILNQADLIIWIGAALEPALSHLLKPQRYEAEVVRLIEIPGLLLLPVRDRQAWHSHGHDPHMHDANADLADKTKQMDNHIWLSPDNSAQIVRHLTQKLVKLDASNREQYMANSQAVLLRLQKLDHQIQTDLAPVKSIPYIVFHDAYQYFEAHYGLDAVGTVSIDPEQLSGARHIRRLRETIQSTGARCLFTEPQFEPKLAHTLVEDTPLAIGQLDPLGKDLPVGPDSYFSLMKGLSGNILDCLSKDNDS